MSLAEVEAETELARPTAWHLLLTLQELGYVRQASGMFTVTPRVLRMGIADAGSLGLWDLALPHLEDLVACTQESSSMAQTGRVRSRPGGCRHRRT
jgi:IclR family transcriptional regulator, pca regulon regulatory protein